MFTLWIKPIKAYRHTNVYGMTKIYLFPFVIECLTWKEYHAFHTTWGVCYKGADRGRDIHGWRHHSGMHRQDDLGRYQN